MRVTPLPQLLDRRQDLFHICDAFLLRRARLHPVELVLIRSAANTKLKPSSRDDVAQSCFSGEADRMPVRGGYYRCTQSGPSYLPGPRGENLERVGGDRGLDRVVFGGENHLETAFISDPREFLDPPPDLGHWRSRR